jgi:hypothetical protein
MRWQGIVRDIASRYQDENDSVVIGCEKQYRFLYQDLNNVSFLDFDIPIYSRNMWMTNDTIYPIEGGTIQGIPPTADLCHNEAIPQIFLKWGKPIPELSYDILIHARSTNNCSTGYRNWPVKKWEELVKEYENSGVRIACVGSLDGAYFINNAIDARGIELSLLADIMASSTMLLSPSSGPAHFASLCGLKHIVWSGDSGGRVMDNEKRYKEIWNPHGTECKYIPTWQPSVEQVMKEVEDWL